MKKYTFEKMQVSKLDAARRQLETAIRLFFYENDPVSIHTLTAASYNILQGISKHRSAGSMLVKQALLEHIKPQYQSAIRRGLNEAENFFKHADKDPGGELTFKPHLAELLIWDASTTFQSLASERLPILIAFIGWFMSSHPEYFRFRAFHHLVHRSHQEVTGFTKREYFEAIIPRILSEGLTRRCS